MRGFPRTALAALLLCAASVAQAQVPNHSLPVGVGPGSGFRALGPCSANAVVVGNGATADPGCGPDASVTISGHSLPLGGSLNLVPGDVGLGNVTNDVQTKASVMPNTAPSSGAVPVGNGSAYSARALTSSDVGLGSVTNDAQTKAAILPNTAPLAGQIAVGNAGNTAYAPVGLSGDCGLASSGAITCTKTSGSTFGYFATGTDRSHLTGVSASGTLSAPGVPIGASTTGLYNPPGTSDMGFAVACAVGTAGNCNFPIHVDSTGRILFGDFGSGGFGSNTVNGAVSPNNSNIEFNNPGNGTGGANPVVPIQNNQFSTIGSLQPNLVSYRAHCADWNVVDWSTCLTQNLDNGMLLQTSFNDGYKPQTRSVVTATVTAGGSGYSIGDTITLAGGTLATSEGANDVRAIVTVDGVSGNAVTSVHVTTMGGYSSAPSGTVTQFATSGGGSGATFTVTTANHANPNSVNLAASADTLCGSYSGLNVPARLAIATHNPNYITANTPNPYPPTFSPNGMLTGLMVRCTGDVDVVYGNLTFGTLRSTVIDSSRNGYFANLNVTGAASFSSVLGPLVTGDGEIGGSVPLEGAATNLILQSQSLCTSPWTTTNLTCGSAAQTDPFGGTNYQTLTTSANGGKTLQNITVPADTTTYAVSLYFNAASAGTTWSIRLTYVGDTGFTAVYTAASGGTSCVNGVPVGGGLSCTLGSNARAVPTANGTRLSISAPNTNSRTTLRVEVWPNGANGAASNSIAGFVQVEATAPTSYIPTTSSSASRTAGQINPTLFPVATSSTLGIMRPDNATCSISSGVISCAGTQQPPTTTFANLQTLSPGSYLNKVYLVTDLGPGGSFWVSDGTFWKPMNVGVLLGRSAAAGNTITASIVGTTETTLASVTVPAPAMGNNGCLVFDSVWSVNATSDSRTLKAKVVGTGGTATLSSRVPAATDLTEHLIGRFCNRGAQNSQVYLPTSLNGGTGGSTGAVVATSIDTSQAVTFSFTGTFGVGVAGTDTITLESYMVRVEP